MSAFRLTNKNQHFDGAIFPRDAGGDSLYIEEGDGSTFYNCEIIPSSRSGIITTTSPPDGRHGPLVFVNTSIHGSFDATVHGREVNKDPTPSKWGAEIYRASGFAWIRGQVHGFEPTQGEHCFYFHSGQGDMLLSQVSMFHAGRTAVQDVHRKWEGTREMPPGYGDRRIIGCNIQDVCLEAGGGGSALTFKGGAPGSNIVILKTTVKQGSDPKLHEDWRANITGCVSCNNTSGFAGPGYKSILIDECDMRMGEVWKGQDQARRTNVNISGISSVVIRNSVIISENGRPALDVSSFDNLQFDGVNDIRGEIRINGAKYGSLTELKTLHPELFEP